MENQYILLRYGDLMLKGKNIKAFKKAANILVKEKTALHCVKVEFLYDHVLLEFFEENRQKVVDSLYLLTGFSSFSFIYLADSQASEIKAKALAVVEQETTENSTFKVVVKRVDKQFTPDSQTFCKELAGYILKHQTKHLKVDVHTPLNTLHAVIKPNKTYIYFKKYPLIGGLPAGISGKVLTLLSGGIDSPVAAFSAIKKGCLVELIHFESTPLTPVESLDKVFQLARVLAKYMPGNSIKIHVVAFKEIHEEILKKIPDAYIITVMRRFMYKIAEAVAQKVGALGVFTGESVGQVASQTLQSIYTINEGVSLPVFRPLAGMDKNEIIAISKQIGAFLISIKPFEDCCTVYLPKNPTTSPKLSLTKECEDKIKKPELIENCVNSSVFSLTIKADDTYLPSEFGLDFSSVYPEILKENK